MPYITSVERLGIEQGRDEGKREALRRIVRARFQTAPDALEQRITTATGATLDLLLDRALIVQTIADL